MSTYKKTPCVRRERREESEISQGADLLPGSWSLLLPVVYSVFKALLKNVLLELTLSNFTVLIILFSQERVMRFFLLI